MIITIARECGCNGDVVGKKLAEFYGIPLYDKRAMVCMAKENGLYERTPNFFREKPVNSLLYAIVAGGGESDVFQTPIRALRNVLGGQDCVVIGRCGNYVFRDQPETCRIFLFADFDTRVRNISEAHQSTLEKAEELVEETDQKRMEFQKFYTGEEWGKASNYDLCLDVGELGVDGAVAVIQEFIHQKFSEQR